MIDIRRKKSHILKKDNRHELLSIFLTPKYYAAQISIVTLLARSVTQRGDTSLTDVESVHVVLCCTGAMPCGRLHMGSKLFIWASRVSDETSTLARDGVYVRKHVLCV